MEAKHFELLGAAVRQLLEQKRFKQASDEVVGKIIVQYVDLMHMEAERDMRDRVNGKGENDETAIQ